MIALWKQPALAILSEGGNRNGKLFSNVENERKAKEACEVRTPAKRSQRESKVVYGSLLGQFKALADLVSSSDTAQRLGNVINNLGVSLTSEVLNILSDSQSKSPPELQSALTRAVTNAGRKSKTLESVPTAEEYTDSEKDEFDDAKVICPPLRKSYASKQVANIFHFKSRKKREKRRQKMQKAHPKSRRASLEQIEIPKKPKSTWYACPFCSDIGLQNNSSNVERHVIAKHNVTKEQASYLVPEFISAAAIIEEKKKAGENQENVEAFKPILISDDSDYSDSCLLSSKACEKDVEKSDLIHGSRSVPTSRNRSYLSLNLSKPVPLSKVEVGTLLEVRDCVQSKWKKCSVTSVLFDNESLSVRFDDEVEDAYVSCAHDNWRVIKTGVSHPLITVEEVPKYRELYDEFMSVSQKAPRRDEFLGQGAAKISAIDYSYLQGNSWLSDEVIRAFAASLCKISRHRSDKRIFFVNSQAIRKLIIGKDGADRSNDLRRWTSGIHFHEVDYILWPIHDAGHWSLCVGFCSFRKFCIVDPKFPYSKSEIGIHAPMVQRGLNITTDSSTSSELSSKRLKSARADKCVPNRASSHAV